MLKPYPDVMGQEQGTPWLGHQQHRALQSKLHYIELYILSALSTIQLHNPLVQTECA